MRTFVRGARHIAASIALATAWWGCGGVHHNQDTSAASGGGGASSTGGSGASSSGGGGAGAAGGAGAGGSAGEGSAEDCLESAGVVLDCTVAGTVVLSVYGERLGCFVTVGPSTTMASFLFWIDDVVDGDAQVVGLRLAPPAPGSFMDDRIEFTAPAPVPLSTLPTTLAWPVTVTPNPAGAAINFSEGQSSDAQAQLLEPIDAAQLPDGTETARGTFSFQGGTYQLPTGPAANDPSARGIGCFHLPAELHPLELD